MSGCCCGNPKPEEPDPPATSCCSEEPEKSQDAGCCAAEAPAPPSCCGGQEAEAASSCCSPRTRVDWLLWGSLALTLAACAAHLFAGSLLTGGLARFTHGVAELMGKAWWGILAGIFAVAVIGRLPRDLITGLLGRGGQFTGILRATAAGTLLDLCNHGILMVGMQLYRKGASLGQTLAFLVASPWNSLSLTLILIALIGWKWTLAFIALSMVVGILTGWIADALVAAGRLPSNPNQRDLPADFRLGPAFRQAAGNLKPSAGNLRRMLVEGLSESRMVLRWIFFGLILAGAVRAFVPTEAFQHFFGPTLAGLGLTLLATTVIEVCSEGSSPVAADLLTRAAAPGNSFTFLMAGAATDYTEILALRETTRSWKATLALPLITTPQVLLIGWLLNRIAG